MKTIHEEAEKYVGYKSGHYTTEQLQSINDFKAGVEFAQRWIPIEKELPPFERVLLKSESGYVEARTITQHTIVDGKLTITLSGIKVVEWRLI